MARGEARPDSVTHKHINEFNYRHVSGVISLLIHEENHADSNVSNVPP